MNLLGLIELPTWLLILLGIGVAIYIHYVYVFQQFKRLGLKGPTPLPFVGTMIHDLKLDPPEWPSLVRKYGKVYGSFMGTTPNMIISDPEMVKQITVKEFSKFPNHRHTGLKEPPFESMLTMVADDQWRHIRNHITPAFSSGKLKRMMAHINNAAKQLVEQIGSHVEKGEQFEFRKPSGNFTMDVIAGTAFGIQVDSQKNPDDPFVMQASKLNKMNPFGLAAFISIFLPFMNPYLHKLGIRFVPKEITDFFLDIITRTKESRKEKKGGQVDFIQMMADAEIEAEPDTETTQDETQTQLDKDSATPAVDKTWTRKGLTTEEVLAQSYIFFLAGYDNTGNALALLMYNLALSQDAQDKAREEITRVIGDKEKIEYDDINKLTYLNQCLQESLRIYPPAPATDRFCKEDCEIEGYTFKKGVTAVLGIYNIHMDPELYPEPKKFDPERFSSEAVAARHPYSWLPFGHGPRNCIGLRLVMIEIKMAAAALLRSYKFLPCEKTEVPLKMKKFRMNPEELWLKAIPVE